MIVTGIEEVSRSRSKVCLEGDFAFVLYKGEIRFYGIREGEDLPEESCREILDELLPKRATLRCMHLLKDRAYTEGQLRRKLDMAGYPPCSIGRALEYVKSYGYVDDLRYALDYIQNQKEKKSRRVMERDLVRKGVPGDIIGEAFRRSQEEENGPDEEALARKLLRKKHFDPQTADREQLRKMSAFLYRKGIGGQIIRKLIFTEALDINDDIV